MKPDLLEKAIEAVLAQDASISPLPRAALESQLKPKAIIPVDLFGQAADYDAIMQIAERHGLKVIEDAAQSFGASQKGKKLCALACHAAATSFFPAKPLGCYGDGGAVFTDDDELAEILRSIRVHGKGTDKYDNVRIGLNGRIDTLQAAILLAKLDIFEEELAARSQVAAWYSEALSGIAAVRAPSLSPGNTSAWAQYSIVLPENTREKVVAHLRSQDIPTNIYYPTPLHMLGAFKDQGHAPNDFAVALETSRRILALPFHPYMDRETVEKVCRAIHEALL